MGTHMRRGLASVCVVGMLIGWAAPPAVADEVWVAPTSQTDLGGLTIASNGIWPVTPVGAVRLAWAVPDDLQTFQSAKVVLIPHSPGGAATLTLFICPAQDNNPVVGACAGPFAHAFTGVANQLLEVDVSAAIAPRIGNPGKNYLAVVAYTTPTTTTDHVVGLRFTYDPVAPLGVPTLGANTFTGTQTAPAFVGDGSALTNVNANLLDGQDSTAFAAVVHGHDVSQITNAARLGTNTFTGTQTINTGNLDLDPSTSATGLITKNGAPFLHDVGAFNTFLGLSAGNLTMTGNSSTATGSGALQSNTTGSANTATGVVALQSNTTGSNNTATGVGALQFNTAGSYNTAIGRVALLAATGSQNTAVGDSALANNTGSDNVAVGFLAGVHGSTGSNNIYLGANVQGLNESDTIRIGLQGTQTRTIIAGIRAITTGAANAIPVLIDSNGQLGTASSSRRYKEDIRDMADTSRRVFQLRPVTFRYKQVYGDGSKPIQYGLIAEEVAEAFPELAVRNADGELETVHYETLNVLLLNELQKQEQRAEAQARRIEGQDRRIESLERRLDELLAKP